MMPGYELTYHDSGIRCIFHFSQLSFSHLPRKSWYWSFFFLNQGTKTNFFLAVKIKNNFNMHISFLWKKFCWCCLDMRFFSLIHMDSVFLEIHFSYLFFFILCIDILRIVLQLLDVVLNLFIIKNYIMFHILQSSLVILNTWYLKLCSIGNNLSGSLVI